MEIGKWIEERLGKRNDFFCFFYEVYFGGVYLVCNVCIIKLCLIVFVLGGVLEGGYIVVFLGFCW